LAALCASKAAALRLRTFDKYQPFPEEINRRIASVIADLHFAPTMRAKEHLLREGIPETLISVTGNPVIDALQMTAEKFYDFSRGSLTSTMV
jgi:UDP-N-acetylglucosamine 2-epimerase (non-hydrolysing)